MAASPPPKAPATSAAISAVNSTTTGSAASGAGAALYASATGAGNSAAALYATNSSASGYAGFFNGAVNITGPLSLTGGCIGCVAGASTIYLGSTTTANPQVLGEPTTGFTPTATTRSALKSPAAPLLYHRHRLCRDRDDGADALAFDSCQ